MEKTIRELAIELNISKEAIYRKVNHSMKTELVEHTIKKDGKTYISDIGQSIILQSLKRETDDTRFEQEEISVNNNVINTGTGVNNKDETPETLGNDGYIRFLEKQIELLQERYDKEVNNNRNERETLYRLNQTLVDTINREQQLQFADRQLKIQEKQALLPEHNDEQTEQVAEPKGFLNKLFKRKIAKTE